MKTSVSRGIFSMVLQPKKKSDLFITPLPVRRKDLDIHINIRVVAGIISRVVSEIFRGYLVSG